MISKETAERILEIAFAKKLLDEIENRKEYNPTDPFGEMEAAKKLIVRSAIMTQIADKERSFAEANKQSRMELWDGGKTNASMD